MKLDDERQQAGFNMLRTGDKEFFGDGTNSLTPNIPAPTSSPNQDVYASHYNKGVARPTMVNINIGELAHFDRTSVASSAQEREMMAAMEEKIAESIYSLSMTALNNLNKWLHGLKITLKNMSSQT